MTAFSETVPGTSFIDDFLQMGNGVYDPAFGNMLASGNFEPAVEHWAAQGVGPPEGGATGAPDIGKALSGVKAPTAPQAEIPRVQAPAPPAPNAPANQNVIVDLINQVQGRLPTGGIRLGQAIPGVR